MAEKTVSEMTEEIAQKSGKTPEEVKALIDTKVAKFSGLLTENGAAYMVQKELGIRQEITIQTKVNELSEGMKGVEMKGEVTAVFPVKEFEKAGKKGKLKSFLFSDGTGEVRGTLWNDQVEKYDLTRGSEIELLNAVVSVYNEKKQITLGFNGTINILNKKEEEFEKLSNLKAGMNGVNIFGRIIRKFPCKEFENAERKGKLCAFQLGDESAIMRVTAWNEKADEIMAYEEGDAVEILGAYTKEGRFGVEVNLGYSATIAETQRKVAGTPEIMKENVKEKKINALVDGESAIILGKVANVEKGNFFFEVCKKCGKKAQRTGNGVLCEKCGETEMKKNAVVSLTLEDDTGSIRASFFGENALKALGMNQEELESALNGKQTDVLLAELNGKLGGKEMKIYGYQKTNNFSGEPEFSVREIIG